MIFITTNTRYNVIGGQYTIHRPTDHHRYRSYLGDFYLSKIRKLKHSHTVHSEATKQNYIN